MPKPRSKKTEVVAAAANDRRQRRRFSAEEKVRILAEADACTGRGEIGELLRREGIYSSHLTRWRAARDKHGAAGLAPGRKPGQDAKDRLIAKLKRDNAKLEREDRIQQRLIELQRKAHEILGVALPRIEDDTSDDSSSSSHSARRRSADEGVQGSGPFPGHGVPAFASTTGTRAARTETLAPAHLGCEAGGDSRGARLRALHRPAAT